MGFFNGRKKINTSKATLKKQANRQDTLISCMFEYAPTLDIGTHSENIDDIYNILCHYGLLTGDPSSARSLAVTVERLIDRRLIRRVIMGKQEGQNEQIPIDQNTPRHGFGRRFDMEDIVQGVLVKILFKDNGNIRNEHGVRLIDDLLNHLDLHEIRLNISLEPNGIELGRSIQNHFDLQQAATRSNRIALLGLFIAAVLAISSTISALDSLDLWPFAPNEASLLQKPRS